LIEDVPVVAKVSHHVLSVVTLTSIAQKKQKQTQEDMISDFRKLAQNMIIENLALLVGY